MNNITPTLTPRHVDYKSKAEALAAFNADEDFTYNDVSSRWHGMACNKSDLSDLSKVKIRYNKLTMVFVENI